MCAQRARWDGARLDLDAARSVFGADEVYFTHEVRCCQTWCITLSLNKVCVSLFTALFVQLLVLLTCHQPCTIDFAEQSVGPNCIALLSYHPSPLLWLHLFCPA